MKDGTVIAPMETLLLTEPREVKCALALRALLEEWSYTQQPANEDVQNHLDQALAQADHDIQLFLRAHPCSSFNLDDGSTDALDLFQTNLGVSSREKLIRTVEMVISKLAFEPALLLQVLVHTAIYTWAFNDFKECFQEEPPAYHKAWLAIMAENNPELSRKATIALDLEVHRAEEGKRDLEGQAYRLQRRVSRLFLSLRDPPLREGDNCDQSSNDDTVQDFLTQEANYEGFEQTLSEVFLKVLTFRASLAKCGRRYETRFFPHGTPFDGETMDIHPTSNSKARAGKVLMCMTPAIFSYSRKPPFGSTVKDKEALVGKASVFLLSDRDYGHKP